MIQNELKHYGVKGMKWGKRRYVNKDGSLTAKGKARKKAGVDKYERQYKNIAKKYAKSKANNKDLYLANKNLKDSKIHAELLSKNKQSDRQKKLTQHYQDKGYSEHQAAIEARKRIKVERAALIVGGLTIAAASAYAIKAYRDKNVDKIIKQNVSFTRVSGSKDGVRDVFYATTNKNKDKRLYEGHMAYNIKRDLNTVYKHDLSFNKDVKIASRKTAAKKLDELMEKDPSIKKFIIDTINDGGFGSEKKEQKINKRALKDLKENKGVTKNVYKSFNTFSIGSKENSRKQTGKLYDALKKDGYGGIEDLYDKEIGTFKSKAPLIIFENTKNRTVNSVRELSDSEINKNMTTDYTLGMLPYAITSAVGTNLGIKTVGTKIQNNSNLKKINEYKEKHPNTRKTDNEILKTYVKEN